MTYSEADLKEWNLSDKISFDSCPPLDPEGSFGYFENEDVREFIKRLKELSVPMYTAYGDTSIDYEEFYKLIDKLAGEKLI